MTRKDYELIAENIKLTKDLFNTTSISDNANEVITGLSYQLAQALAADNKAFDKARFLKACGIGE